MEKYNPNKIEAKWQKIWEKQKLNSPDLKKAKRPFYNLMMFPYPSAEGLHVGNMYAFVHSDCYGRYQRLKGFDVFEPIGLDGFGIHSENYAIKKGEHILAVSRRTEKHFYKQLRMIGNQYDWEHTLETYKPEYYKWTQWIFVQMFKRGLAYQKESYVNWCPSCKTVLSDEQVIAGKCERCASAVEKKMMKQWFFRITDYAERLLKNLDHLSPGALGPNVKITEQMAKSGINWSERTKIAQRNWIGRSEGAEIIFPVVVANRQSVSLSRFSDEQAVERSGPGAAVHKNDVLCFDEPMISCYEASFKVFTTRLDTIFGCTYCVLAPEHPLISSLKPVISNWREVEKYIEQARKKSEMERTALEKEKTGVELKGIKAINPFNNQSIPIFVADYVLGHYGTGAVMAVPAHDSRDWEFAKKYGLKIVEVVKPKNFDQSPAWQKEEKEGKNSIFVDDGILVDSGEFTGLSSSEARVKMIAWLEKNNLGGKKINYKLRDWCISRQRYWGPPIPIIYCSNCCRSRSSSVVAAATDARVNSKKSAGYCSPLKNLEGQAKDEVMPQRVTVIDGKEYAVIPVPEKDLPVLLPKTKDYLPRPDGLAPLARNKKFIKTKCPICGGEARRETDVSDTFLDSAWYFFRYPSTRAASSKKAIFDPDITRRWLPVDMYIGGHEHAVLHLLYSRFVTMFFKDLGLIDFEEPYKRFFAHGLLISEGAKMSKSKGNVINPDEYVKKYGADAVRMYLMFLGDVSQGGDWRDAGMNGMYRFINRIWRLKDKKKYQTASFTMAAGSGQKPNDEQGANAKIQKLIHQTIKKVSKDLEALKFNTAIAALMTLVNGFEEQEEIAIEDFEKFIILLFPFAPHISEELWSRLGHRESVSKQKWPEYDAKLAKDEMITLVIQINGKVRDRIEVAADILESEAKKTALASERIKEFLADKEPKKIIFVKGRLINIVV